MILVSLGAVAYLGVIERDAGNLMIFASSAMGFLFGKAAGRAQQR